MSTRKFISLTTRMPKHSRCLHVCYGLFYRVSNDLVACSRSFDKQKTLPAFILPGLGCPPNTTQYDPISPCMGSISSVWTPRCVQGPPAAGVIYTDDAKARECLPLLLLVKKGTTQSNLVDCRARDKQRSCGCKSHLYAPHPNPHPIPLSTSDHRLGCSTCRRLTHCRAPCFTQ